MKTRRLTTQILETRRLLAASIATLDGEFDLATFQSQALYSTAVPSLATQTRVIEPSGGVREVVPNNGSFQIEIVPGLGLRSEPEALRAVRRAADQWEAKFFDPITVTIQVDFVSQPDPSLDGILGLANAVEIELPYSQVRAAIQADGLVEGDDSIVARLPDANSIEFALPAGLSAGDNISLSKANAKALGLNSQEIDDAFGVSDGVIVLNPFRPTTTLDADQDLTQFDFNREDGIDQGDFDLESIVAHEIGHVLGFISAVDRIDTVGPNVTTVSPSPLDLFRFRSLVGPDNPRTPAAFETVRRELRPSTPAVLDFVLQDGWSDLLTEYPVELGIDAGLNSVIDGVDFGVGEFGFQASHWQAEDLFGETIGILAPVIAPQTIVPISNVDLRAFDLIGYDILPPGVDASAPELINDQATVSGVDGVVIDVIANDQNNTEALDLSSFRIVEPPALGAVTFDPVTGLLVYQPEQVASDDIDIFTYTIADSRGLFAQPAAVEVTITGNGLPPIAIDDFVFARGGQTVAFNPLANDVAGDEELSIDRLLITGGPSSGSIARDGQGFAYTPNEGFEGSDRVTYSIEDSRGNIASATVEITVGAALGPVVIPGEPLTLLQRADTNSDTHVTAFDALQVINFIGRYGSRELDAVFAENDFSDEEIQDALRLDVNRSGGVSSVDAIITINRIEAQSVSAFFAEPESLERDDEDGGQREPANLF